MSQFSYAFTLIVMQLLAPAVCATFGLTVTPAVDGNVWYCQCRSWNQGAGVADSGGGASCGNYDAHAGNQSQSSSYATYDWTANNNYYSFLDTCMYPYAAGPPPAGGAPTFGLSSYVIMANFSLISGPSGDLALTMSYHIGTDGGSQTTTAPMEKGDCLVIDCTDNACSGKFSNQGWTFCFNGVVSEVQGNNRKQRASLSDVRTASQTVI